MSMSAIVTGDLWWVFGKLASLILAERTRTKAR